MHPRKCLEDGLKNLETDIDVNQMALFMNDSKMFNVYAKENNIENNIITNKDVEDNRIHEANEIVRKMKLAKKMRLARQMTQVMYMSLLR